MASSQLIDHVDNDDRPIGVVDRSQLFQRRVNFRVAHIFIFDSSDRLLIQKLAPTRDRHPGAWGSSVACYVEAGEDYSAAAKRRLREELGITGAELAWIGRTQMEDEGCVKFIGLFSARHDRAQIALPDHIAELRYLSLRDLVSFAQNGESFTPTFRHIAGALLNGAISR